MSKENIVPVQAVVLAGGESSRYEPFNSRGVHKSTQVLMGEPIIAQTIQALERSGVTDVIVVKSDMDSSIESALEYIDQDKIYP